MSDQNQRLSPKENDVLIQREDGKWSARYYNKKSSPKLVCMPDHSRTVVFKKALEFVKPLSKKIYTRTKAGNIVLNNNDNPHLVNAIAEGGVEELYPEEVAA